MRDRDVLKQFSSIVIVTSISNFFLAEAGSGTIVARIFSTVIQISIVQRKVPHLFENVESLGARVGCNFSTLLWNLSKTSRV